MTTQTPVSIGIGPDLGNLTTSSFQNSASGSNAASWTATLASSLSPVSTELSNYYGNPTTAAISSAIGNAAYSGASTLAGSTLGASYSPSFSGSTHPQFSTTTTTGTPDMASSVEDIMASNVTTQAYLIGVQSQISQQGLTFQAVSNVQKAADDSKKNAIQNFR